MSAAREASGERTPQLSKEQKSDLAKAYLNTDGSFQEVVRFYNSSRVSANDDHKLDPERNADYQKANRIWNAYKKAHPGAEPAKKKVKTQKTAQQQGNLTDFTVDAAGAGTSPTSAAAREAVVAQAVKDGILTLDEGADALAGNSDSETDEAELFTQSTSTTPSSTSATTSTSTSANTAPPAAATATTATTSTTPFQPPTSNGTNVTANGTAENDPLAAVGAGLTEFLTHLFGYATGWIGTIFACIASLLVMVRNTREGKLVASMIVLFVVNLLIGLGAFEYGFERMLEVIESMSRRGPFLIMCILTIMCVLGYQHMLI